MIIAWGTGHLLEERGPVCHSSPGEQQAVVINFVTGLSIHATEKEIEIQALLSFCDIRK